MICHGQLAFSLLTLSGIAVFVILRRKSYPRNATDNKKDMISKLPDDILISIITRIPTKFAIATSILSKSWCNLYVYVSDISLCCDELLGNRARYPHNSEAIIYKVERLILRLICSGYAKMRVFRFKCCLTESQSDRFEQCLYSLARFGVEELDLSFACRFKQNNRASLSSHVLSDEMPSLKHIKLALCTLQPNLKSQHNSLRTLCKSQCNSLQTLGLTNVTILPGAMGCILSNCTRLHSLNIIRCTCPSKLCFRGPNLQLKSLVIYECYGVEKIEFYASNLIAFEFKTFEEVDFVFDLVPRLQSIFLSLFLSANYRNIISYAFGELARDLPHLKSMSFYSEGGFCQESNRLMEMGTKTFINLRRLELILYCTSETNLLSLTPFLQSCPLLQEFSLNKSYLEYDRAQERKQVELHSELKKVEIYGFEGKEIEIEFALHILKSAVILEQMQISRCEKRYMGLGCWKKLFKTSWREETHKKILKQLQGQAISKTAQLIVRYES